MKRTNTYVANALNAFCGLRQGVCACVVSLALAVSAQEPLPARIPLSPDQLNADEVVAQEIQTTPDGVKVIASDTIPVVSSDTIPVATPFDPFSDFDQWEERDVEYNPDPTRAVWMSALFPGLGQVYNRRYWKLPLIVGGYLGLAYATSWNNTMLTDYTRAYRDIMDTDPTTNSYMDFFPPTVSEESLDKQWLSRVLQTRKNYFRRNRDLCIISMVGVYLLAMVDAYVDASLSHFDISTDLSMDVSPVLIQDGRNKLPSVGLLWAFNF